MSPPSVLDLPFEYRAEFEKKFWSNVEKSQGCWTWRAGKTSEGYGEFHISLRKLKVVRRMLHAHRISFELIKGRIEDGYEIDHLCRNPSCVNPNHLEAVSHKVNALRGYGVGAINARKTHCKNGHLLSQDNLDWYNFKRGYRVCKICRHEYAKNWKSKRICPVPDGGRGQRDTPTGYGGLP